MLRPSSPVVIALCLLGLVACGDDESSASSSSQGGGGGGEGGATSATSTTTSTSTGATPICTPGDTEPCYGGPNGTLGVGLCRSGARSCDADGLGWGACVGDVRPREETCGDGIDEDCDGTADEANAGCSCVPGEEVDCYEGPQGTENVGLCRGGTRRCDAFGSGYGPCQGQVVPQVENCATTADEDCDGQTPSCAAEAPVVDLRADNDRDGVVSLDDPSEDADEHTWGATHGAVFLANIDDDLDACPTSGNPNDATLAGCFDAADEVVNGPADLLDLARLRTAPWAAAPSDASAHILVSPATAKVRLFKRDASDAFVVFHPETDTLGQAELVAGVELAIEATDIVRDASQWDGYVDLTLLVDGGTGASGAIGMASDTVRMRVAPVLFRHHLDPAEQIFASAMNYSGSQVFRTDLQASMNEAAVPVSTLTTFNVNDQWNQDYFETAYMAMPGPGGEPHAIDVNFRSANHTGGQLRSAGRVVFGLRGPDIAAAVQFDPSHSNYMDTLNSFGNFETIPPFSHAGKSYPMGRVFRGGTPDYYPDKSFDRMVDAQSAQLPVWADTSWLLVSHIDETLSFLPAPSARGWVVLASDPTMARAIFEAIEADGGGSLVVFKGKRWYGNVSAQTTVSAMLDDIDVMNDSAWAAVHTADQLAMLASVAGVSDAEIVSGAHLFGSYDGYLIAHQPGVVNGIVLSSSHFGAPKPWGPVVDGRDAFEKQLEDALAPIGVDVSFIENWDLYHALDGEVHCGSNTRRKVPTDVYWWGGTP